MQSYTIYRIVVGVVSTSLVAGISSNERIPLFRKIGLTMGLSVLTFVLLNIAGLKSSISGCQEVNFEPFVEYVSRKQSSKRIELQKSIRSLRKYIWERKSSCSCAV